ncbi:hypothetical protein DRN34_03800 [Thermococci archaeon]|nr:MAG: hypothetical protein DRN34_03800 [Thermococci archaeon]
MANTIDMKCPNCSLEKKYIQKNYGIRAECLNCGHIIHIPGAKTNRGDIGRSKCPNCGHMQAHKIRGHKHVITCNNCGDRFPVEMPKKPRECPKCGRVYDVDDRFALSRCPSCKTPFKRATIHISKQGRCKSIW